MSYYKLLGARQSMQNSLLAVCDGASSIDKPDGWMHGRITPVDPSVCFSFLSLIRNKLWLTVEEKAPKLLSVCAIAYGP